MRFGEYFAFTKIYFVTILMIHVYPRNFHRKEAVLPTCRGAKVGRLRGRNPPEFTVDESGGVEPP